MTTAIRPHPRQSHAPGQWFWHCSEHHTYGRWFSSRILAEIAAAQHERQVHAVEARMA